MGDEVRNHMGRGMARQIESETTRRECRDASHLERAQRVE
jgi:hypothetical protein